MKNRDYYRGMKSSNIEKELIDFFDIVPPIKLSECCSMKLNAKSWGVLTDYFLESVKINRYKHNVVSSTAILKVTDGLKQVTCVVKGKIIGLLFGLNEEEWSEIENLCGNGQQLFYRFFKDGLSRNFNCEQKLFYNFCLGNQNENVLIAVFCKITNMRNKDKSDTMIQIIHLMKKNSNLLEIYFNYLRGGTNKYKYINSET